MKIAIDARIISTSTGRYIERLITYLEKVDTENSYTILVRKKDVAYWKPTNPNFQVVVADYPPHSFAEQLGFMVFLYQQKFDLVHFCMFNQPLFYFKKHITTVMDLTILRIYNSDKNWLGFHIKQLIARCVFFTISRTSSHIITLSQFTKDDYTRFSRLDNTKVTVTYASADTLATDATPYQPLVNKQFVLYVGRQPDYKNIKNLIIAHQSLIANHPKLHLVLVGRIDHAARMNMDWVKKMGYKNILFTDFISDQSLAWLYQHCTVYAFPSLMEGFGLPGLEAMVEGAPVISSNTSCLPEIYGDAAYYFNPLDTQDIATAMSYFLQSKDNRSDYIKRGKKQAKKYSWKRMAEQTYDIYSLIVAPKS